METCSNCGASVRPGAKFCTGCGNRLNDVDTSGSGQSGWDEPARVENAPPSHEATVGRVVSTRIVSDGATTPAPEPAVVASEQPATAWTWGSLETDDPAARVPVTTGNGSEQSGSSADSGQEPAPAPSAASEPFQWSWNTPSSGEPATEATATDDESRPVAESSPDNILTYRPSDASTIESPGSVTNLGAETSGENESDRNAREAEIADMPPPYDWRQSVTYGYKEKSHPEADVGSDPVSPAVGRTSEEPSPSGLGASDSVGDGSIRAMVGPNDEPAPSESTDRSDTATRVLDLLDQLRSLIPELAASRITEPDTSADVTGARTAEREGRISEVISDLERARERAGASGNLRPVLEAAMSRPRDMDVVLDLVGQAGRLVELLDERDQLVSAIEQATSALRELQ